MKLGALPEVMHADHRELAAALAACGVKVDAVIADCPYSERTHSGHDSAESYDESGSPRDNRRRYEMGLPATRRGIGYAAWSPADVAACIDAWAPIVSGWWVSITDHVLAPSWSEALDAAGLYTFSPLPFFSPGSRVRLTGDGPSSWTTWIIVARPRRAPFVTWGTLPGGYHLPPERSMPVVGGKPLSLMRALVRDYTRPGDLVCDPCCGAGTTLLAAKLEGRRAIGCDIDAAHVEIARERLRDLPTADKRGTRSLFAQEGEAAE